MDVGCTASRFGASTMTLLELYTDSVFRYEPFGIFPVFFIPKPKGNSVGKFGIIKLAGAIYTHGEHTHTGAFSAQEFSPSLFSRLQLLVREARTKQQTTNNKQQTTKSYEIRQGS
jgi:hypothetical protein